MRFNTRTQSGFIGQIQNVFVNIRSIRFKSGIGTNACTRLFPCLFPQFFRQACKCLSRKSTSKPRCASRHNHSGFNRNGSGAAHRVPEQHILTRVCHHRNRRRKGLTHGSISCHGSVAALMQCNTGSIDHQRRNIFEKEKLNLIPDTAFRKIGNSVFGFQTPDHRLFNNTLAVRYGKEPAFDGMSFHGKCVRPSDPFLPRQSGGSVKQCRIRVRRKRSKANQHPFGAPQMNVCAGNILLLSFKIHSAVDCFRPLQPKTVNLFPQQLFHSKHARCHKSHSFFSSSGYYFSVFIVT